MCNDEQGDLVYSVGLHYILAISNKGNTRERFGKKMNGPEGQKLATKKSLAVSVACMAVYGPATDFTGRTFEL